MHSDPRSQSVHPGSDEAGTHSAAGESDAPGPREIRFPVPEQPERGRPGLLLAALSVSAAWFGLFAALGVSRPVAVAVAAAALVTTAFALGVARGAGDGAGPTATERPPRVGPLPPR